MGFGQIGFCAAIVCATFYLGFSTAALAENNAIIEPVLPVQRSHNTLEQPDVLGLSNSRKPAQKPTIQPQFSPFGLNCDVRFSATALPTAMVQLNLTAPCHISAPITIRHNGLLFTATTSNIGHFNINLPALQQDAKFDLLLAGSNTYTAKINIPTATDFRRVALVWAGQASMEIHAFELLSSATKTKHIWRNNPENPHRALQGRGGFLIRFDGGTKPNASHTEIYSFPTGPFVKPTTTRLHVKISTDKNSCGKNLTVTALQSAEAGKLEATNYSLTMPTCDKVGEHLLLKNLLTDLKTNKPYN